MATLMMLTEQQRAFLAAQRVARLATADAAGRPHVVPVCYALLRDKIYFTIDEKPKRKPTALKRLANLRANPVAGKTGMPVKVRESDGRALPGRCGRTPTIGAQISPSNDHT